MPTLPIPLGGAAIHGGDLPVSDGTDVLEQMSEVHRAPTVAQVRDDLCAAFAVSHTEYQDAVARGFAQVDPLRATGIYLDAIAYEHGVVRLEGESDASLRSRIFIAPAIVTPQAIVDALNTLLAPYTSQLVQLVELELDGLFIPDDSVTAWGSFIECQPRYLDRFYLQDEAENGGFYLTCNEPWDSLVSAELPRNFHLLLPELESVEDELLSFVVDAADEIMPIADGTNTAGAEADGTVATSIFNFTVDSVDLYAQIVNTVNLLKGQGITWSACVVTP